MYFFHHLLSQVSSSSHFRSSQNPPSGSFVPEASPSSSYLIRARNFLGIPGIFFSLMFLKSYLRSSEELCSSLGSLVADSTTFVQKHFPPNRVFDP